MIGLQPLRGNDNVPIYLMNYEDKIKKAYCTVNSAIKVNEIQRVLGLERKQYSTSVTINGDATGYVQDAIVSLYGIKYVIAETHTLINNRMASIRKDFDSMPSQTVLMLIRG